MSGGHVPHPACEGGWRRPVDAPLSMGQWRSILALLPPAGERPLILEPAPRCWTSRTPPRRREYPGHVPHDPEPHWAFVDPVTGELMDTAATSAMLRRMRETPR